MLPSSNYLTASETMAKASKLSRLGELIRTARKGLKLTQPDLADQLGLDAAVSVCRWERGRAPVPPSHFRGLSAALKIPIEQILAAAKHDDPATVNTFRAYEKRLGVKPVVSGKPIRYDVDINPDHLRQLKDLAKEYPKASLQDLVDAAMEFYLARATHGLDGHFKPLPDGIRPLPDRKHLAG